MMVDKIKELNERLKEVRDKFEEIRKCGIDSEIFEVFMKDRTKLSRKKIKEFIENMEEFYEKLVCDFTIKEL